MSGLMYDADRLKKPAIRDRLASAMADITGYIEEIEEALADASDTDMEAELREAGRETVAEKLAELFTEVETLQDFCDYRLAQ